MNQRGLLADFLMCKVGVAFAALALLGAVLAMVSTAGREAERGELAMTADAIIGAIRAAEGLPGEVEIERALPALLRQVNVTIIGTRGNGSQMIRVLVDSEGQVERALILVTEVNGGEFKLTRENPSAIRVCKASSIRLELI